MCRNELSLGRRVGHGLGVEDVAAWADLKEGNAIFPPASSHRSLDLLVPSSCRHC
jgi:hypothetical protein